MLTVPAMLGAPLYFEALRTCSIAVTAAGAAGPIVMDLQLDLTERALSLDDRSDRVLGLVPQWLAHGTDSQFFAIAAREASRAISPAQTLAWSEFSTASFWVAG